MEELCVKYSRYVHIFYLYQYQDAMLKGDVDDKESLCVLWLSVVYLSSKGLRINKHHAYPTNSDESSLQTTKQQQQNQNKS